MCHLMSIIDESEMESSKEEGRFPKNSKNFASVLLRVKGTLGGKYITISSIPIECNNYIGTKFVNQLPIPVLHT
jgi:hypothetical protein